MLQDLSKFFIGQIVLCDMRKPIKLRAHAGDYAI